MPNLKCHGMLLVSEPGKLSMTVVQAVRAAQKKRNASLIENNGGTILYIKPNTVSPIGEGNL